ncbi:SusC/RagA family TonB-linked outer membrane protein [Pedobacter sp. MR22-3]|uniref:SusC/RagA family TonB-linked outer membrane protein n=1 Tax=Pedobacter sp. MR22-3 TaxID=2994552 RepID=UPI0022484CA7|nr:SusC/RagA family TonB-linked outer membrane protein [Pedobacter sp. MR22-3]MCX2584986.1 SusC/RagA family TonB-linked outer membrane protein [Pedobacter sp. MR22-3]
MKKSLLIFFCAMMFSWHLKAQKITITGKVTDTEQRPLVGASIFVAGQNESVYTDQLGGFAIQANSGDQLSVAYVGFKRQTIILSGSTGMLHITLESEENQLADLVVTGALGIKRSARELGTSTQTIKDDYLNQGKTINPLNGLTSKVSGLRVNMFDSKVDPQIQIVMRGSRSLNRTKNEPIYVLDGVPVPSIGRINPNDIEEITVLKGANAAALYGSEGVNGAIMISTRQGAKGRGRVTFSNTTTFSKVMMLPPAQQAFGQGVNGVYVPTQYESWGPAFDGTMKNFGPALPNGTQPQALYATPDQDKRLELFDTGLNMQNDVSFSGGDDKSTYFLSVQDVKIKGIIPEDESRRTGARFNGARKFGKLNTSYNVNYVLFNKNTTPDGPWITAYQLPANFDFTSMRNWQDRGSNANPANFFTDQQKNPYFQIDNYRDDTKQQTLNGKVELDYQFTPWFKALYRFGYYATVAETRSTVGKFEGSGQRNVNGSVNDGSDNFRKMNNDLILSFNKDFGKFTTRLLIGQNLRSDYTKAQTLSSANLLFPDLFNQGSALGQVSGRSTITQFRSLASYGEFTAGYHNYLFLTLTGRNDWVSTLSKENRSYFYPGLSTSFVFSEAITPLKNSKTLSFGKIYASYNKTGNNTLNPYSLNNPYSQANGFPFGNLVGFLPGATFPNPDIEPEFVTSYEAGIQLGLFNNRLNFEGAYVFSDSKGQIFNATTSRATGYASARVNAGRLTNSVIELNLNGDIIRNANFKWNLGFNYTYINNQVKELFEGLESFNIFRQSYANIGQAYPSLQVSDYKRDPNGNVVINATNGNPVVATDAVHLGTMVPPHQMGLNTMVTYRNISLGAQFDWRMGGWLYSEIVPRMYTAGTHPATIEFNRQPFIYPNSVIETSPGVFAPNTTVLSKGDKAFWQAQGAVQSNTAAKSDFFKMRELNISYNFPAKLLARQNVIKEARLSFIANNLFLIRHQDNTYGDPEYLYNDTDGYISFRQVPPYRTFGFNINVVF